MTDNKLQKKFAITSIIIFMSLLVLPTVVWFGLKGIALINPGIMETVDYDLGENRNKAEFPSSFSASYTAELEAYYNDRLPFRSMTISANRELTSLVEAPYNNVVSPYLVELIYGPMQQEQEEQQEVLVAESVEAENVETENVETGNVETENDQAQEIVSQTGQTQGKAKLQGDSGEPQSENIVSDNSEKVQEKAELQSDGEKPQSENAVPDNSEKVQEETGLQGDNEAVQADFLPPKVHNNATIEGRENWLFFAKENSLEDYLGNNILSQSQMDNYISKMNALQKMCEEQGKQLYFIILPNKEQIYSEYMPSYTVVNEYKRAERLVDYIHANSNIKLVYPMQELLDAKSNWQVYLKNDTHWNSAGGFIGVQALYREMGIPTTDLSTLSVTPVESTSGDLLSVGNLNPKDYAGDIWYRINYKPEITVNSEQGNNYGKEIYNSTSSSPNACSLALIGDSFRINMAPFLVKDFSDCLLMHKASLMDAASREKIRNADIIIIESVERHDYDMPNMISAVMEVLGE